MFIGEKRRRARRRERLQMAAAISAPLGRSYALINDISELGMRVTMAKDIQVKTGDEVSVYTREMGFLYGKVTWQKSKTLGVKIHTSTNTYAQTLSAVREAQAERNRNLL
ncbi:MAG: PilZ domain-containing protein [Lentilitoribacter sp.]|mmetsp:Transcript_150/g.175  ORF Transcript_150/g.175 Transcript_150/m.175 type:complete len:110 (+) Transcript_150:449-778(+)